MSKWRGLKMIIIVSKSQTALKKRNGALRSARCQTRELPAPYPVLPAVNSVPCGIPSLEYLMVNGVFSSPFFLSFSITEETTD